MQRETEENIKLFHCYVLYITYRDIHIIKEINKKYERQNSYELNALYKPVFKMCEWDWSNINYFPNILLFS